MMINTFGSLGFNGAPLIEGCAGKYLVGGVSDADEARKLRHAIGLGEASYSPIAAQFSITSRQVEPTSRLHSIIRCLKVGPMLLSTRPRQHMHRQSQWHPAHRL